MQRSRLDPSSTQPETAESRIASFLRHTPQEQETAGIAGVEEAQPMEVDIEVEDGKQQDREKRCGRAPVRLSWSAIQGILGIDLENAYGAVLPSRVRNTEPRGQPRWRPRSGAQEQTGILVQEKKPLGDNLDGTRRVARSPQRAAPVCNGDRQHEPQHHESGPPGQHVRGPSLLEELNIELQACGHRLRMHRCVVPRVR